jgi:hypothetical protein
LVTRNKGPEVRNPGEINTEKKCFNLSPFPRYPAAWCEGVPYGFGWCMPITSLPLTLSERFVSQQ